MELRHQSFSTLAIESQRHVEIKLNHYFMIVFVFNICCNKAKKAWHSSLKDMNESKQRLLSTNLRYLIKREKQ